MSNRYAEAIALLEASALQCEVMATSIETRADANKEPQAAEEMYRESIAYSRTAGTYRAAAAVLLNSAD